MDTHRLNIEFPSDEYTNLKKICAEKGVSIKDFVVPVILAAIEEEKSSETFKKMNSEDLIPIKDAFKEAGWNA